MTHIRHPRQGVSRRRLLQAAAGLPLLAACHDSTPLRPESAEQRVFQHGVASGDPLADRVILWTRISAAQAPATVRWEVYRDPFLTLRVTQGEGEVSGDSDGCYKVDVSGLDAGRTYYYRFLALDQVSPTGRTRTLPRGAVERLRLAVCSCAYLPDEPGTRFHNAYGQIAQRADLDAVLHLGDYVYADSDLSLAEYRARHAQYKAQSAELREAHRQHPFITVWDDHETTDNCWQDGGYQPPDKPLIPFAERKQNAMRAYHEWLPIRTPDPADLGRIWRSFDFGDLLTVVAPETRLHARAAQAYSFNRVGSPIAGAEGRELLGAEQMDWLRGTLRAAPTQWKLFMNPVQIGQLYAGLPDEEGGGTRYRNMDQWDGYAAERGRLFDILDGADGGAPVQDLIFMTGDWHCQFANDVLRAPYGAAYRERGEGVLGTEFTIPCVSSGLEGYEPAELFAANPHFKNHEFPARHGHALVDLRRDTATVEFWHTDTVETREHRYRLNVGFPLTAGANRIGELLRTPTPTNTEAPSLAP
ncbi:hypothetical protein D0B54_09590 [Solimonas sp. K1W22B-7]|uniref:alkaline phosphatase D family protein n=1 Tax=Solimonas sp. K1W22B-7 TaxID=2303331 RepID=UPI000E331ACB|nr:alkaline phosphatase D family protein [Solimonas sp. K1W22B-7]AXQ28923.1 hypothetical protein D0B54_09590 [Solimonas sp. K1W22B-7]